MTVAGLIGIAIGGLAVLALIVVIVTVVAKATSRAYDRKNQR
jgi:hypothetical protein